MFLNISIPPEVYIILAITGILFILFKLLKQIGFINRNNYKITEGTIIKIESRKINYIARVDEYLYTYTVHGEQFTGKDQEISFFSKKQNNIPEEITVRYLKKRTDKSQLCFINHLKKNITIFIILIVIALAAYRLGQHKY